MVNISREIKIQASPTRVWEMILDLVMNPLRYMPLATSGVSTPGPGGTKSRIQVFGFVLEETISLDETNRKATYTFGKNPDWSGSRTVHVGGGPKRDEVEATTLLYMTFDWTPISEKARALSQDGLDKLVQGALERLKEYAEAKKKG